MSFQIRFLNRLWDEGNFSLFLPKAVFAALMHPHFENFLFIRMVRFSSGLEDRRKWLLSLAVSWLAGLVVLAVLALLAHLSSYTGAWAGLWTAARSPEPPLWVFLLADARAPALLLLVALGFLPALLTGWGFAAWFAAPLLLFPGLLSLPGAWCLILAERLALFLRAAFLARDPITRRDLLVRSSLSVVVLLVVLVAGPIWRELTAFWVGGSGFQPEVRFLQWVLGLILFTSFETAMALAVLHFYYAATCDQVLPERWSFPQRRLLSPWDLEVLRQVRIRADQRWKNLNEILSAMDEDTKARIPVAILRKMTNEMNELERLRQKSERR